MPKHNVIDPAILEAALINLETQRTRIDDQIDAVRSMLEGSSPSRKADGRRRRKNRISAEGRARIGAAARKRWAAVKKAARAKKKAA
jgi:hypothetical protein